ncbi:MAG: hypothetical protein JO132_04105 [Streptosporangiaceae bacterium]|nr:hypothetical protein [Streptosporangiaceae bacterium]
MVALFLRTELPSDRWRDDLRALLKRAGLPDRIVTAPDLGGDGKNQARLRLLTEHRGNGTRTDYFVGFPGDVCWQWTAITPGELAGVRYIEYDYWNELSGGTRLAVDAAARIRAGVAPFGGAQTTGCLKWRRPSPPGPVPPADPCHNWPRRRRPGGAGGPRPPDLIHARLRPVAAGTGGPDRILADDEPLGLLVAGPPCPGDRNRTRAISLRTLWRCPPPTWRFRDLRGSCCFDRKRP